MQEEELKQLRQTFVDIWHILGTKGPLLFNEIADLNKRLAACEPFNAETLARLEKAQTELLEWQDHGMSRLANKKVEELKLRANTLESDLITARFDLETYKTRAINAETLLRRTAGCTETCRIIDGRVVHAIDCPSAPLVPCPNCRIKVRADDLEDNGVCAVCNGADTGREP